MAVEPFGSGGMMMKYDPTNYLEKITFKGDIVKEQKMYDAYILKEAKEKIYTAAALLEINIGEAVEMIMNRAIDMMYEGDLKEFPREFIHGEKERIQAPVDLQLFKDYRAACKRIHTYLTVPITEGANWIYTKVQMERPEMAQVVKKMKKGEKY